VQPGALRPVGRRGIARPAAIFHTPGAGRQTGNARRQNKGRQLDTFYIVTLASMSLILIAAFSSLLAERFGAPLLLLFLLIGLVAGVDGLGIDFSNNSAAFMLGSIALAIILFDSGYGTSLHSFRQAALPALTLATIGVVLTAALFGVAARLLLGFSWLEGLLLGSIVASTDAAAVFFLLRTGGINIRDKVRSTLEVESGTNDPMAIFLTAALVGIMASEAGLDGAGVDLILSFVKQIGLGLVLGLAGGFLIVQIIRRIPVERGLAPIFVLALALLVFAYTSAIGGSGFLAVYVAGIYAGNKKIRPKTSIIRFQEGMTWLAQIIMFLVLGLLATPSQFPQIVLPAIALAIFLVFVARPLAVWLCLLPFNYTQRETGFVAWVGLRGAVSILLAILPILGNLENGQLYFNTTFIVVMVSLAIQGWTVKPIARRLGLIVPPQIGAIDKLELDLPGTANHELLAYRVVADSPVLRGKRIPRWARPSLVIRDGKSMRYQYAGRLQESDHVYLFIAPGFSRLLDRLFASKVEVGEDDSEFFGTFTIDPSKTGEELDQAYGPGLLNAAERSMTITDLMKRRLGDNPDYADRVQIGRIVLIVRQTDEHGVIKSVGISLEPVAPVTRLPLFLNLREIIQRARDYARKRRG